MKTQYLGLFTRPLGIFTRRYVTSAPVVVAKHAKRSRFTAWDGIKTLGDASKSARGAMIPVTVSVMG